MDFPVNFDTLEVEDEVVAKAPRGHVVLQSSSYMDISAQLAPVERGTRARAHLSVRAQTETMVQILRCNSRIDRIMGFVIHEATKNDASTIGKLVYSLMVEVKHESPNMNEVFYTSKAEELLESSLPNHVFIARDAAGNPVGFITIGMSSAIYAEGTFGVINELYVLPQLRSAGIGKLLLDAAKRLAVAKGWTRLEVTAAHEQINPLAIRFYQRENFVETGPRLKFELRKNGSSGPAY